MPNHMAKEQLIEHQREELESLRQQVAERDACIQVMREALKACAMNCVDDFIAAGGLQMADTTPSPELLNKYVADVVRRVAEKWLQYDEDQRPHLFMLNRADAIEKGEF